MKGKIDHATMEERLRKAKNFLAQEGTQIICPELEGKSGKK
jgi:hypothetical protein